MSAPRSPRLRSDRPFRVVREAWFGGTALNGHVWRITSRVKRGATRAEDYYITTSLRDGGPLHEPASLAEALAEHRQYRLDTRREFVLGGFAEKYFGGEQKP